jgi:hypothetical protein
LQPLDARHVELAPLHATGDHNRVARQLTAIRQSDDAVRTVASHLHDFLGREDLRSEAPGLSDGPARQVVAAQAGRKAQIVFDPRTESGLTARSFAFHDHCFKTLRSAVHARSQPRGSAPDNHQIEEVGIGTGSQTEPIGELALCGVNQGRAVREDHDRKLAKRFAVGCDGSGGLRIALRVFDVQPLIGNVIPREELAGFKATPGPARTDDPDAVKRCAIGGRPLIEQIVQDRIEIAICGIPGLQQVMVELDDIDCSDGGFRVGVCRQEHATDIGELAYGLGQKLDATHVGHAVIGYQEGDRLGALRQPAQDVKRASAGIGGHHTIAVAIPLPQVAFDGPQHIRVVVHRKHYWSRHCPLRLSHASKSEAVIVAVLLSARHRFASGGRAVSS